MAARSFDLAMKPIGSIGRIRDRTDQNPQKPDPVIPGFKTPTPPFTIPLTNNSGQSTVNSEQSTHIIIKILAT
jgi:hypothetical protein